MNTNNDNMDNVERELQELVNEPTGWALAQFIANAGHAFSKLEKAIG